MKQIRAHVDQGTVVLNSREIQDIIQNNNYFEDVIDISHGIHEEDILGYQVKLDSSLLEKEVEKDLEEEGYILDDEEIYDSVLIEQAEYFIDAAIDEIKDRIETRYHLSNVGSAYDVYDQGGHGEDVGFILALSFGGADYSRLHEITNSVLDKHYTRLE